MALMLGATLRPARILEALLEISATGFEELFGQDEDPMRVREQPASAVFLFGKDGLYVAASRNIHPPEARQTVSADAGALYEVLSQGKPVLVGSLADDPALRKFTPFRRCHSAICVPLSAGFEIYGAPAIQRYRNRVISSWENFENLRKFTGYALQRRMASWDVHCDVIAPSLIPKRPGDRCKTDERDAKQLALLDHQINVVQDAKPAPAHLVVLGDILYL